MELCRRVRVSKNVICLFVSATGLAEESVKNKNDLLKTFQILSNSGAPDISDT